DKLTKEDVSQLVYSQFKEKITSDKAEEFQMSIKKSLNEAGDAKKISENNIRTLIKYGANINAICGEALNDICFDHNLDILNILIENGLDVNQNIPFLFNDNEKLIKIAARRGQEKIVKRLLEVGAKDTRSFIEKIKTHLG
ncbi:MAG: ankyrin repeat domain-containing protein, partial [Alphaproteobacteria bacterium]